ncbi:hypothetical protein AA309_20145 [Microvirga vignae]|uniref:GapR-like DNA-binding domain-containing protein n=1 Tax=Microvirga vignae TaxID=1225564 RepID=A0A0H1RFN9_9HYPH|nr:GapR family DNA-binding domain-containing protein [Microvirga vignae]KLK91412.1 hypothetical protein AA309_20145 [Microvirga vignae]
MQQNDAVRDRAAAADQLRQFMERIKLLEKERKGLMADIRDARRQGRDVTYLQKDLQAAGDDLKDVYAEAKRCGFDKDALAIITRESLETESERRARQEFGIVLNLYRAAIGLPKGDTY